MAAVAAVYSLFAQKHAASAHAIAPRGGGARAGRRGQLSCAAGHAAEEARVRAARRAVRKAVENWDSHTVSYVRACVRAFVCARVRVCALYDAISAQALARTNARSRSCSHFYR
eukprot:IDg23037t1